MEKRRAEASVIPGRKRKARSKAQVKSEIQLKHETEVEERGAQLTLSEFLPHYCQEEEEEESEDQLFDDSRVTFSLQDLADAGDSKSVTLVSLTATSLDSTQLESTEDSVTGTDNDNSERSSQSGQSSELPEQEHEDDDIRSESGLIMAGPTNPLGLEQKSTGAIKPFKFVEEYLHLTCEWVDCNFETRFINAFMEHVASHQPAVAVVNRQKKPTKVFLVCKWNLCPYKCLFSQDLARHLFLHAYHTKLKCLGLNAITRSATTLCRQEGDSRNIIPDLSTNLVCAWDKCSEAFINIQMYYDHIHYHCQDQPPGKKVKGGIRCLWSGCTNIFQNKTKLQDHMRSHTQEKVLACPTCGGLFSNRTRLLDHCRRQDVEQGYACDVCMKAFSTPRLLRDHIRSHINNYRCPDCDMSCTSPSALASHMKYRHSEEKPFPCSICEYAAKSQSDITRHIKGHGQSFVTCEVEDCNYRAKTAAALNYHYEKTHGDSKSPRYQCHICHKRYHRGNTLTKHLIGIHKLVWPAGHSRFRYRNGEDNYLSLLTLRYESEDVRPTAAQIAAASLEATCATETGPALV